MTLFLFIAFWVACGVLSYGVTFAFFQREFPELAEEDRMLDQAFSAAWSLFGPVNLLVGVIMSAFFGWHGFKWR